MSFPVDWLKAIQLKPRYLFGIFMLGLLIVLLPKPITDTFGITEFREHYRSWVGLFTLAAFCLWLVHLWPWFYSRFVDTPRQKKTVSNYLDTLNELELFILRYCLFKGCQTVYLPFGNKVAQSLSQKGIVVPYSVGDQIAFPYTIPTQVWNVLLSRKEEILPASVLNEGLKQEFKEFEEDGQHKLYYS
jgi:hypothetical protein